MRNRRRYGVVLGVLALALPACGSEPSESSPIQPALREARGGGPCLVDGELGAEDADGRCRPKGCPARGRLFWTEGSGVRAADLDGRRVETLATGMFPTGTALAPASGKLYWADNGSDSVQRSDSSGPPVQRLYTNPDPFSNPEGVAVDEAAGLMFWTEGSLVRSARLDGTGVRTVATGQFPWSLAVDTRARRIYWADNGSDTVNRAGYDGSGATVLYQSADPFSNPRGVALDAAADRLFWAEGAVLRSARLDGSAARVVATGSFPTSVAVDEAARRVYWTDNGTDTVQRMNYDGSGLTSLYTNPDPFSNPRGIAVCGASRHSAVE